MSKFIFVTGGVVSGLGKGVIAASLGRILKQCGLKVIAQKLDPYINLDPGTMNPYQHGEVFVTEDGAETDLDLGHYERFIDENLNKFSNLTAGQVYWNVLKKERNGKYLGNTVQVIPHITNEIKDFIYTASDFSKSDVIITEIGGTVGDIEIQPFLEAARQISIEVNNDDCLFIHVTLVPFNSITSEHKSKPTQHSVKELRMMGINPGIIVTRSESTIEKDIKDKIALFCNVSPECVIENINLKSIYDVPIKLEESGFSEIIIKKLSLKCSKSDLISWTNLINHSEIIKSKKIVKISIVGKYVKLKDSYLSIIESLMHSIKYFNSKLNIDWIDSDTLNNENINYIFKDSDGILIPGGFGSRGIEGMIKAVNYARINNKPYFGICLGMQIAVIEFARNVLNFEDANSTEFNKDTKYNVVDLMEDQKKYEGKGGTMRLGSYPCVLKNESLAYKCYGVKKLNERHRHRFEFNNKYLKEFENAGLKISGKSPDNNLVEIIEIKNNNFFIGVQFHPEFKSRPGKPHPLFREFIKFCLI